MATYKYPQSKIIPDMLSVRTLKKKTLLFGDLLHSVIIIVESDENEHSHRGMRDEIGRMGGPRAWALRRKALLVMIRINDGGTKSRDRQVKGKLLQSRISAAWRYSTAIIYI
jgi:hypothetical protein